MYMKRRAILAAAAAAVDRWTPIVNMSGAAFRKFFDEAWFPLGLGKFNFRPYSVRRGAAVSDYLVTFDINHILFRGSWSCLKVGRIYVRDRAAASARLQLPLTTTRLLKRLCF